MFTKERLKKSITVFIAVVFLCAFFTIMMNTEKAEAKEAKKGKEVVVNIIFGDTPDWTLLEDHIDWFYNKNPNIKVNLTFMSHKEMVEKATMELQSGSSTYDVIYIDNFSLPQLASAGWLEPQNKFIEKYKFDLADYGKGFVDALSYKGKIYSPPYYAETCIYYYRKDLFDKYGIKKVPETYEEARNVAKKLTLDTNGDGKTDVFGWVQRGDKFYGYVCYTYAAILRGYGSDWFDSKWNPIFNNKEGMEAATIFADLMRNYAPPGEATYGWHEALADFAQGRAAQYVDASPFGPRLQDPNESTVVGKVGYAIALGGPVKKAPGMYTCGHAINAYSKNKEAAWKFVEWTMSPEINKLVSNPSRFSSLKEQSIIDKFNIGPEGNKFLPAWVESLKYAVNTFPAIPEWPEIGDRIGVSLNRIIVGADVKKELDAAAADVAAIMKKAGYLK